VMADNLCEMEQMLQSMREGRCPICKKGGFRSIASHIVQAHGIYAVDLREKMGLARSTSICDPDYARECADCVRLRDPQELREQLAHSYGGKRVHQRALSRLRHSRTKKSPEGVAVTNRTLLSDKSKAKAAYSNRHRSAVIREAQTKRIRAVGAAWRAKVGPKIVAERMAKMRELIPPETYVKAGGAATTACRVLREDPKWYNWWRRRCIEGGRSKRNVPLEEYATIRARAEHEKYKSIAASYGCSRTLISNIVRGRRGRDLHSLL